MEGEVVAAVVRVLVQNIIDHFKEKYSRVRGLKKEAEKLGESLDTIQKYLNDAEKRTITDEAVKSWLKKLENVAFDAENVLDELNYHHLCKQIKHIKPMKQKVLLSFFSPFADYSRSRSMAVKIKEINEDLEVINKQATDLRLQERIPTDVPTLPDPARETDCVNLDPIFIGRDKVASEIVEKLTDFIATDEHVSILAIVGMGGLGKTTLTRKVFHLLKQKTPLGEHIWVHVSQIFEPMALLKKILKELTPNQVEVGTRQEILKKIQEALKDRSYLLILDDVWNEVRPKWDDFIHSLLGATSTKGNAIVVTTRSMEVAFTVSALYTHKLEGLSKEDCWSIIKERTFGKEEIPLGFEAIGVEIAEKCQGLPLAASVVSGILRDKKSEDEWHSIKEKWHSSDEGGYITKILKLSFDNLSLPSLKKCFAYCSVFSKGHRIKTRELIEYRMGEGFLVADESNDMESMGDKFINILLHSSLLQIAERYSYMK